MADAKNKRELVKACIELGTMTKADIAEEYDMTVGAVSTNMTYLRWADLFILTDKETKILTFTDKATFDALEAEKASNKGGKKTSARTPAERAIATAKTIANQEASKVKWEAKVADLDEMLETVPDDADVILNLKEANASIAILEVKLVRNEALAATLPSLEDATAEVEAVAAELATETAVENVEEDDESTDELL